MFISCNLLSGLKYFQDWLEPSYQLKKLSVLMLCTPVIIFTSGSSALLGCPRCSLSIWLSNLAIFNTLFRVYTNLFHEETDKTRKYSKDAIFVWHQNDRRRILGAQGINTEKWTNAYSDWLAIGQFPSHSIRDTYWWENALDLWVAVKFHPPKGQCFQSMK